MADDLSVQKAAPDESPDGADDWLLRDAIFDRVGEVYADEVVAIVRDWLATYERAGCGLGDAQQELELTDD